jgi:serine acetyltransferase
MNTNHRIKRFLHRLKNYGVSDAIKSVCKYVIWEIKIKLACDIRRSLPATTKIIHPVGIVIGVDVIIGENVQINQNVTLGNRGNGHQRGQPTIGDNVTIYTGAVVLGDITVGTNARIGANSVVLADVDPDDTVVGVHK